MLMVKTPSPRQTHSLYMNVIEKHILEIIFYCSENIPSRSYVHTHTQRKHHCIFTETPHTQCNQASCQLVHSRTPWEPVWPQLHRAGAAPARPGGLHRNKSQAVPTLSPAVLCPAPGFGGLSLLLQGHEGWLCLTGSAPAALTAVGQPGEHKHLRTSAHNVQQHHGISCCLALFGFQWFI